MEAVRLGRIMAFTDNVMGVAITLLVLNIDVPTVANTQLAGQLDDLLTPLAAYALSFALVGRFWVVHHRLFETLHDFDGVVMTLNLVFLALIVLIPFSTNLMSEYASIREAAIVFSATVALAGLANWAMAEYARRHGFVEEERRRAVRPWGSRLGLGFTGLFCVAIPAAYLDTRLSQVIWVCAVLVPYPLRLVAGRGSDTSA